MGDVKDWTALDRDRAKLVILKLHLKRQIAAAEYCQSTLRHIKYLEEAIKEGEEMKE